MENDKELAKEERTIFIVLAIIIMIAIGVLVTWYFTKDKELSEDKNDNKKTEVVEKQKKKKIDSDTKNVVITPSITNETEEVIVYSPKVLEAEQLAVVNVSDSQSSNETGFTVPSEEEIALVNYDGSVFYLVGENILFENAVIKKVQGIYLDTLETYENTSYNILDTNVVKFNEIGSYLITLKNNDGSTSQVVINIIDLTTMDMTVDAFELYLNNNDISYLDENLYNELSSMVTTYKENNFATTALKREYFNQMNEKYDALVASTNLEAKEIYESKQVLNQKINSAINMNQDEYTEESYANLQNMINEANLVISKEDVTKEEIEKAINDLTTAIESLEAKSNESVVNEDSKVEETQEETVEEEQPINEIAEEEPNKENIVPEDNPGVEENPGSVETLISEEN